MQYKEIELEDSTVRVEKEGNSIVSYYQDRAVEVLVKFTHKQTVFELLTDESAEAYVESIMARASVILESSVSIVHDFEGASSKLVSYALKNAIKTRVILDNSRYKMECIQYDDYSDFSYL
jgi:hypothetical protein